MNTYLFIYLLNIKEFSYLFCTTLKNVYEVIQICKTRGNTELLTSFSAIGCGETYDESPLQLLN